MKQKKSYLAVKIDCLELCPDDVLTGSNELPPYFPGENKAVQIESGAIGGRLNLGALGKQCF